MATYTPPEPWASAMIAAGAVDQRRHVPSPSINELGRRAGLAVETVRRMIRGVGEPDPANVSAVADALGVSVRKVSGWVDQARALSTPYRPPSDADLLNDDERAAIDRIIRLMAASKRIGQHGADGANVTRLRAAAYPGDGAGEEDPHK